MTTRSKILLIVLYPPLLWSIPSYAIFLTLTHEWQTLLIPFVGFYPGPVSGTFYWLHHALNEILITIWGCLTLLGYIALASHALRTNSKAAAMFCATLLGFSTLMIYGRLHWS
jgi:hypothetical protein